MKVKLIGYTKDFEKVIAMAGKLCYSPVGVDELEENLSEEKIREFRFVNPASRSSCPSHF